MSSMVMKIGDHLRLRQLIESGEARDRRERARVPTTVLGDELGVWPATNTRWELGQRFPRGALARKYLRVLDQLDA